MTVFLDAETKALLGDAHHKFLSHCGEMSSGDRSDPRFGTGQGGLQSLVDTFDTAANDPRASDAQRAECIRARDFIAGTLAGLKGVAR